MKGMILYFALVSLFLLTVSAHAFWYDELTGYWVVTEEINPWTDELEIFLTLPCNETIRRISLPIWKLEESRALVIRFSEGIAELYVGWSGYLGESDAIAYRFDYGEIEENQWGKSSSRDTLFFPRQTQDLKSFVRRLIETERLIVGISPEGKERQTAVFDVRGLGNALLPHLEHFGWEEFAPYYAKLELVFVERGIFTMRDAWGDELLYDKPTHTVRFTYDFFIGKYEVTFDEYDRFCETTGRTEPDDEGWGRGQRPVINVSWWDAIAYCNWLSEKEGLAKAYDAEGNFLDKEGLITMNPGEVEGYRLPTEAEWEFAARGGNKSEGYKYAGSANVDEVAWYNVNSESRTQEIGKKLPNELGIHEMSGNVVEWCSDYFADSSRTVKTDRYVSSGTYRVLRGGSWFDDATGVRIALRYFFTPAISSGDTGFRIARTAP